VGEPAGKTTQTDTSSDAQSRQVAGAAERASTGSKPIAENGLPVCVLPMKAPVPDEPNVRPQPAGPFKRHFHAASGGFRRMGAPGQRPLRSRELSVRASRPLTAAWRTRPLCSARAGVRSRRRGSSPGKRTVVRPRALLALAEQRSVSAPVAADRAARPRRLLQCRGMQPCRAPGESVTGSPEQRSWVVLPGWRHCGGEAQLAALGRPRRPKQPVPSMSASPKFGTSSQSRPGRQS